MAIIAIVYFSKTDICHALAEALGASAASVPDTKVWFYRVRGSDIVDGRFMKDDLFDRLNASDAIIFGTPTYMAGPAAQLKTVLDATGTLWADQRWSGKIAAGFTAGSAANGDQGNTLNYLMTFANQHGMIWVGLDSAHGYRDRGVNRFGCQTGVTAMAEDDQVAAIDLATAEYLGHRVAKIASVMHAEPILEDT